MDVAPPSVSSSAVAGDLTPRQVGLILFALTLGGFAIGTVTGYAAGRAEG